MFESLVTLEMFLRKKKSKKKKVGENDLPTFGKKTKTAFFQCFQNFYR